MRFIGRIFLCLFICVILSGAIGTLGNRRLKTLSAEDAGPSVSLLQIPKEGDTVYCEDGSSYKITDVSRYIQTLAQPSALELLPETFSLDSLRADAVHFADISGDYLFVKNRYEIIKMLYTLSKPAEESGICIQLSIPEDMVPIVQEDWNPDQVIASWNAGHTKTCCMEAWDLYKDGTYRRTVYLTTSI